MSVSGAKSIVLFLLFFWGIPALLNAQERAPELQTIKNMYEAIEFKSAVGLGDSLLKSTQRWSVDEYVFLHHYLALAHFNLNQEDSARMHFLNLLSLRPNFELDPVETSPKIIEFFRKVKKEANILLNNPGAAKFTRYVLVEDPRTRALWRSAVIPGWGQFYKGQKRKAVLTGAVFWGSLAATLIAYRKEKNTRQDYLRAVQPADITTQYDTYNRWHKNRQLLSYAAAAVWLINMLDAGLSRNAQPQVARNARGDALYGFLIYW